MAIPPQTTTRHGTTSPACPQSCHPREEPSRRACASRRSSPVRGTRLQWSNPMGSLWWHPSQEEEQQWHLGPRDSGPAAGPAEDPHAEQEE